MSDAARMKRLGIDHLTFQEQKDYLDRECAEIRRKEEEARAAKNRQLSENLGGDNT